MSCRLRSRASLWVFFGLVGCARPASDGCAKDTDCRSPRVCVDARCAPPEVESAPADAIAHLQSEIGQLKAEREACELMLDVARAPSPAPSSPMVPASDLEACQSALAAGGRASPSAAPTSVR